MQARQWFGDFLGLFSLHNFTGPNLYQEACKKIENDANYLQKINDDELLALVRDEKSNQPKHNPEKKALAIVPISAKEICVSPYFPQGSFYLIKETKRGEPGCNMFWVLHVFDWYVDHSKVIYINKKGEMSLHFLSNLQRGRLIPLFDLKAEDFLNKESLHLRPNLCNDR